MVLTAALSPSSSSGTSQTSDAPSTPEQAHLGSQQHFPRQSSHTLPIASELSSAMEQSQDSFGAEFIPKFFELCVNTGEFQKRLGEIDLTRVTNDLHLFELIRNQYHEIRGHRLKKHYLLKPIAMRFVHFCLEDRHRVSILKQNSFPSQEHVTRKEYHYSPCPPVPPPPMPSDTFMHLMKCARKTGGKSCKSIWFHRLPKKLFTSITRSSEDLPTGWGVHIIEGPDSVSIIFTIICVLLVCFRPVVAYVVKTKDVSGATGIGSVFATVLTLLWMAMKIEQWKCE